VFRSPLAVLAWWLWVAFALANWADLAVQGRDRFSLLVALGLLLITGVMYAVALRPRVIAADDGLMIVNPLRDHRIGWAAVSAIEPAELVRVRCEWPAGKRVIHAWAVHSSRRRQATTRMRAARRTSYPPAGAPGLRAALRASYPPAGAPGLRAALRAAAAQGGGPSATSPGAEAVVRPGSSGPFGMTADRVVMALSERAQTERAQTERAQTERAQTERAQTERAQTDSAGLGATGPDSAGPRAQPPASRWHWPSVAALVIPAAALLIAAAL
jgi:Bacterial PH domain